MSKIIKRNGIAFAHLGLKHLKFSIWIMDIQAEFFHQRQALSELFGFQKPALVLVNLHKKLQILEILEHVAQYGLEFILVDVIVFRFHIL